MQKTLRESWKPNTTAKTMTNTHNCHLHILITVIQIYMRVEYCFFTVNRTSESINGIKGNMNLGKHKMRFIGTHLIQGSYSDWLCRFIIWFFFFLIYVLIPLCFVVLFKVGFTLKNLVWTYVFWFTFIGVHADWKVPLDNAKWFTAIILCW